MVIPMVVQTILLDPPGPVWTDAAPDVSSQDATCRRAGRVLNDS
jgi:hypothetical protein